MKNQANKIDIYLQPLIGDDDFVLYDGRVSGFPTGYDSGTLELGFFLPSFRSDSILNFDPFQFISSYKVEIDVFGKRKVPGNLLFPPQTKYWGIIPISLDKPDYKMPLQRGTEIHGVATVGALPISQAVSAIKEKDYLRVLNMTHLTHVGWTEKRMINQAASMDVEAQYDMRDSSVTAQLSNVPEGADALALSLVDPLGLNSDFVGMDVKSLKAENLSGGSGSIRVGRINTGRNENQFVFVGIFNRNQFTSNAATKNMIASIQRAKQESDSVSFGGYLNNIQAQEVSGDKHLFRFNNPSNGKIGLNTNLVLVNLVSYKRNATTQGKSKNVIWSALMPGNADNLELPDLGSPVLPEPDTNKGEEFFWEAIGVKSQGDFSPDGVYSTESLKNIEHVSTLIQKF